MCCDNKNTPAELAAWRGQVTVQISSNVFLVNVSSVGSVVARDSTRQARPGQTVSVVKYADGGWGIL